MADRPAWVARVCQLAADDRTARQEAWDRAAGLPTTGARPSTPMARFRAADPDLSDREQFLSLVTAHLREHPEVVQPWQDYTDDKRTTNTHFLAGTSVGFFDGQNQVDVRTHDDPIDACAEYIYREATMILNGTRVT